MNKIGLLLQYKKEVLFVNLVAAANYHTLRTIISDLVLVIQIMTLLVRCSCGTYKRLTTGFCTLCADYTLLEAMARYPNRFHPHLPRSAPRQL